VFQRALEAQLTSGWLGASTAGAGGFPPINLFQKGDDFVAVVKLTDVENNELQIEARENTIRIAGKKAIKYRQRALRPLAIRLRGRRGLAPETATFALARRAA
jgi:HSP20 family protein